MKKFLLFTAMSAVLLTGCNKPQNENPPADGPQIELGNQANLVIPTEGGTISVTYEIINPVEGGQISAEPAETWIHDFNYDNANEITFIADPNEETQNRSQILTVIYTYGDGQTVQAQINAVQNAAMAYDYESELNFFTGTYYGSMNGLNGEYNYYTCVSDMELVDGYAQYGGTYYILDIFGPAPEDENNPLPPAGDYVLGESGATASMTFTPDYTSAIKTTTDGNTVFQVKFTEGTLSISYEGSNMTLEASLTDDGGKTHHLIFNGPASYEDYNEGGGGSSETLTRDVNIDASLAAAIYTSESDGIMEITIQMTDMSIGADGYVTPPGGILTLDAMMPYDENGTIATGTYTVSESLTSMTLYPGTDLYGMYTLGTFVQYAESNDNIELGYISEGTMEITGGNGNYTISCDFTTGGGHKVTASYSGALEISDMPGGSFSTLTGDYTLDLTGATASAAYWGDYYGTGGGNWLISFRPTTGDDGMDIDMVVEGMSYSDGIPTGTYTAATSDYPYPGEYAQGYLSSGMLGGTIYLGGFDSQGYVTDYAPATSGDLNITNHGDGTYTISFKFIDDIGNTWDGEWTGELNMSDESSSYAPQYARSNQVSPLRNTVSENDRAERISKTLSDYGFKFNKTESGNLIMRK